jgi:hypothetical protein
MIFSGEDIASGDAVYAVQTVIRWLIVRVIGLVVAQLRSRDVALSRSSVIGEICQK